jgi:hypothetical protein
VIHLVISIGALQSALVSYTTAFALALSLGLVLSEVCIPRDLRSLCAPLLYSVGLVVLRDHTNRVCCVAATAYRREQDLQRFSRMLDSKDGGQLKGPNWLEGVNSLI